VRVLSAILVACSAVAVGGCEPSAPPPTAATQPAPASAHESEAAGQARELDAAKGQNVILSARLEELLERERRLSDEVNRLKFLNAQQNSQIQALAGAPAERDALREKCRQFEAELSELKAQVQALQATASRRAPSQPRSRPAASAGTPASSMPAAAPHRRASADD